MSEEVDYTSKHRYHFTLISYIISGYRIFWFEACESVIAYLMSANLTRALISAWDDIFQMKVSKKKLHPIDLVLIMHSLYVDVL